jgi:hypothetical protein
MLISRFVCRASMPDDPTQMAKDKGISLNQFIILARAEKMVRVHAGKTLARGRVWGLLRNLRIP